jgi:hypothetical protein
MNERYIKWWTSHLSRDFEMLVFGGFVDSGKIAIYCPDRDPELEGHPALARRRQMAWPRLELLAGHAAALLSKICG